MAGPTFPEGSFDEAVAAVVRRLRPGEVVTYGEVAEEVGRPGAARAVGGVMARSEGLPWWRVVHADGRLVPGHEREQARRLRAEGIDVVGNRARPASSARRTGARERSASSRSSWWTTGRP